MQEINAFSLTEAAVVWISARENRLSASTERAYRGEIDRLAQFYAVKYGDLDLDGFTQDVWEDYLDELRGTRQHVVTCRKEPLSPSSLSQAIRITTAFLRWARDEELLRWAPKAVRGTSSQGALSSKPRSPLVDLSAHVEPLHPAVEGLLSNRPADGATLEELRAQLAAGLAYWAGLRSSEIAALRWGHLANEGGVLELRHPRLNSLFAVHGNVAATWQRYCTAREKTGELLTKRSPVIAALGSNDPISAWSVWALIAKHVQNVTGIKRHHSAQSLRRSRVVAMGSKFGAEINELAKYARRSSVDFVPSVRTP